MMKVLTHENEIEKAIKRFRERLQKSAEREEEREWAFPDGERERYRTFYLKTSKGAVLVGLPDKWGERVPHIFCFESGNQTLSPVIELNIPLGLDRRVSGVYVKNGKDIWLCTRGNFTSFRGRIKKDEAYKYFSKWLVDVLDGGDTAKVIPITSIESPDMVETIAAFMEEVENLKKIHKEGKTGKATDSATSWSDWEEFEGKKEYGRSGDTGGSYEYLHGPVCNELNHWLKGWVDKANYENLEVRKNINVDGAIVQGDKALAIFEVKTSPSLSEQLYTAVGQLFYYKYKYGDQSCVLFLVLPGRADNIDSGLQEFFRELQITLIVYKDSEFKTLDGKSLSKVLDGVLS